MEIWQAYYSLKSEECPHCGTDARDLMEFTMQDLKCPVCKHEYSRKTRWSENMMGINRNAVTQELTDEQIEKLEK